MSPHPLTSFEIQKYYQNYTQRIWKNKTGFDGVYSRNNLSYKLNDGAYKINIEEYSDIGTH